ncbi:DNA-binding NarL/FixJ family response regulator [Nonlabens dokdonensis]|uniref:DNA-binding NarL/FixJ family response regulator n=2 Tax=Nonlabens dokdonensis TaxID=328515 RepID=A0ABX5Q1J2_9FLAO|nr:response regulator [Nonlabens dokdonensis]AGC76236.1 putative nitrate/nitrite DNA-binding response regulator [Nonlabens dokdonensis DSW-6]PZX43900.1 DNA-binding NarL/FixJ family response regulator [Nonlabens dokdonensis]
MKPHILIVEDIEDIFENLQNKLNIVYPDYKISVSDNCDLALHEIQRHLSNQKVTLLILDLSFNHIKPTVRLKTGNDLLNKLKTLKITIPTIIYSVFSEMTQVYPVMSKYEPEGYVVKSNNSSHELLLAIQKILDGDKYYSHKIHEEQLKRYQYSHKLDDVDLQIIKHLPEISTINQWENRIFLKEVALSQRSIYKRLIRIRADFHVDNDKQLVIKLYKLALIQ